jgi:hypothetical protein
MPAKKTLSVADIEQLVKIARAGDLKTLTFGDLKIELNPKDEKKPIHQKSAIEAMSIFQNMTPEQRDEQLRLK